MWKAARGIAMLDHTLGDVLAVRHLLGALELREPSRMVRALCMEAATEATVGGPWLRRRSERLLETAARLSAETTEAYDDAVVALHRGVLALLSARFVECVEHCRASEEIYRAHCTSIAHELNIVRSFHYGALALLGRLRDLSELVTAHLEEARVRGDRYALAFFGSGDQVLVPLARGDAEGALAGVEASLAGVPDDYFTSFHFYHLLGTARIELYRGEGAEAWRRLAAAWPRLKGGGFLGLEGLGTVLHYLNGCAALAAAAGGALAQGSADDSPRGASSGPSLPRNLERALREAERFLRRVTIPTGAPLAAILRSGMHGLRGERDLQIATLKQAIAAVDAVGMGLHRESLRLALGVLEKGGEAATVRAGALEWMEREGVRDPHAMARSTAPVPLPLGVALDR
jgi:hypothetical protein